jgi:acyl-ACP thioesterase
MNALSGLDKGKTHRRVDMYTYDAIVRYSETGGRKISNMAQIANYLQDCAIFHSEDVGISIDYLASHRRAWFLISWQIQVDRYPVLGEKIKVRTWAYDFTSSLGYRNLDILDEVGNTIVKAASIWSYVDMETLRPTRIEEEVSSAYPMEKALDMEYAPRKIPLFDEYETVDKRQVLGYQIDSNRHMNNEAFVALAQEYVEDIQSIISMRAEYRTQFVKDDIIIVKRAEKDELVQVLLCDEQEKVRCIVQFSR